MLTSKYLQNRRSMIDRMLCFGDNDRAEHFALRESSAAIYFGNP